MRRVGQAENALPFLVSTLTLPVIITWIFDTTRGSARLIKLLHGALNTWPGILATDGRSSALAWVGTAPVVLLAAIVVLVCGSTRLSRKPAAELPEARVGVTACWFSPHWASTSVLGHKIAHYR